MSGVQLTDRDVEILKFINDFGFCEMPQIEKRFGIRPQRSYRVIGRLVKIGLVRYQRGHFRHYGVYYLTTKGATYTDLPVLEKIPTGQYEHQMTLTNVYLRLRQQYPDAYWISERQLKYDQFFNGVGKRGHVADGLLVFTNDEKVAIEVELSVKGKNRIEKILKGYGAQFSIKEVWYYCTPQVKSMLMPLVIKMPFIKVYNLKEFLQ